MTTLQESRPILHGPRKTERLGMVLVLDVSAPQINMVVDRGSQLPRASLIVTTAARRLIELSKAGDKLDHIVVVGSVEDPTQHPDLRQITENLRALRDKWFSRTKLALVSEAMDIAGAELRQTLTYYDKLVLSFEWGTAKTFQSATGRKSTVLAELTKKISELDHVVVQAHFFRGGPDNSTDSEVRNWIRKLQEVKPEEVHILTGPRLIDGKKLKAISRTRQQQIADAVAETGLPVAIHDHEPLLV